MSLVSSRLALKHLATIQRDLSVGTDDGWGNPNPSDWHDNAVDVPCRVWTTTGREAVDVSTAAVIEDVRLIVPLDTDVVETDRVSSVTYRGDVILSGPISVRAVIHNADHLELVLVRIS